jgi:phosphatidylglycerophosphate synthase
LKYFWLFLIYLLVAFLGTYIYSRIDKSPRQELRRRRLGTAFTIIGAVLILLILVPLALYR